MDADQINAIKGFLYEVVSSQEAIDQKTNFTKICKMSCVVRQDSQRKENACYYAL